MTTRRIQRSNFCLWMAFSMQNELEICVAKFFLNKRCQDWVKNLPMRVCICCHYHAVHPTRVPIVKAIESTESWRRWCQLLHIRIACCAPYTSREAMKKRKKMESKRAGRRPPTLSTISLSLSKLGNVPRKQPRSCR